MTKLKNAVAVLLATLGFAAPASATTFSVDYTDLWYNFPAESESGWGINLIQQNDIIFATLFVYGPDGTPRWYVASGMGSSGANTFSGALFSTTGSYFAAPWAGLTSSPQVGTISINFTTPTNGTLNYSVNGTSITKSIVRQTFRTDNLEGKYIGGTTAIGGSCGGDGSIFIHGEMTVNHSSPNITMGVHFFNGNGQEGQCNYSGNYSQVGSLGSIDGGSYDCTIGGTQHAVVGNFAVSEITTSRNGFAGRLTGSTQFCSYTGFFGGIKDVF